MSLLKIDRLSVQFGAADAPPVVEDFSLHLEPGEVVAIVGESGSGKSMSMLALLGLIDAPGRVRVERMEFAGHDMLAISPRQRRRLLGKELAMVFQDPNSALDPCYSIGFQLCEVLRQHLDLRGRDARRAAIELLERVEIPAAATRLDAYPHQLSGGMNQRVAIAMAIAGNPRLLIADEPTTALDVTVQAQIMRLLEQLQREQNMALILISHDLGLVAETAGRASVMYAGQVVESGQLPGLFLTPQHPYSAALLASLPERNAGARRLPTLPGQVPGRHDRPRGCLLAPRCPRAQPLCATAPALLAADARAVRCHFPLTDGDSA
jgi:dipeptide transport system ATP-binding protein